MVERDLPLFDAMRESKQLVDDHLGNHMALVLVLIVLSGLLGAVPLGGLVSTPVCLACIVAAYAQRTAAMTPAVSAAAPQAAPPPIG
jgi:hypothetical protein